MSLRERLPRTLGVLEAGLKERLHVGAQLFVARAGETLASGALGLARPGVPMTEDSLMAWLSLSKIATSTAVVHLWERADLDLDDPVCRHVPEFGAHGKQHITLRHLLTHTCGLHGLEQVLFGVRYRQSFAENVATICDATPDAGWPLGRRAGYQTTAGMLLLAEVIRRVDGRAFEIYLRDEIFEPLGMPDCWIGMPPERQAAYGDRMGQTYDTSGPAPCLPSFAPDSPEDIAHVIPGGSGRGPMAQVARLLELLRGRGSYGDVQLLRPQTVDAMTARQRTGLFDHSWQTTLDWGLGLTLDSKVHHEGGNHLYGYGRHASPRTFGHSGFRTAVAFCDPDPDCELVVACVWNGMVADDIVHSQRQNRLCEAIYVDLGLADPSDPALEPG